MPVELSVQLYAAFTDEIEKIAGVRRLGRIARSIARKADAGAEDFEAKVPALMQAFHSGANKAERRMGKLTESQRKAMKAVDPEKTRRIQALKPEIERHGASLNKVRTQEGALKHTSGLMHAVADAANLQAAKPNSLGALKPRRGPPASQRAAQSRVDRRHNENQRVLNRLSEPHTPPERDSRGARGGGGGGGGRSTSSPSSTPTFRPAPKKREPSIVPALALGGAGLGALALSRHRAEE